MIKVFGNTTKKEVKLDNPLSFDQWLHLVRVVVYGLCVLHNVPTDQVVLINAGETIQRDHDFTNALFKVVYSGENAFHVTVNHFFYTIDFTKAPEIKSILGFESDTLVKGLDNPKRYYMSSSCNQVVVTNGTDSHVLILPSGYYTFTEFIEAVGAEMVKKCCHFTSMTIEDDHVTLQ